MYIVYILRCCDGSLYTGITNNLEQRLEKHKNGMGSKYVRAHLPFELVYTEICDDKTTALKREWEIKKLTKVKKELLIQSIKARK